MLDFLICYEHINREVENDTLLKQELESRGYTCELIKYDSYEAIMHWFPLKKAKVVVVPWLRYDINLIRFILMAKKPYKIVNMQWEQVMRKAFIERDFDLIRGQCQKVYHICWGVNNFRRLCGYGINPENLRITGAMQQDFSRKEFKNYYKKKKEIAEEFSLDIDKPWILLVSGFAVVEQNIENSVQEFYYSIGRVDKLNLKHYNDDPIYKLLSQWHDLHVNSQETMLQWVTQYLDKYDCEFIYRPHPAELVPYLSGLSNRLLEIDRRYSNLHIISNYSVKQWGYVCDKVNLWISTSNAELLPMGIDYNIVRPFPIPKEFETESMIDEKKIESFEEFVEANNNVVHDQECFSKRRSELEEFYDYKEDKPAYVRVADFLEEIEKKLGGADILYTKDEIKNFKDRYFKRSFKLKLFFARLIYRHPNLEWFLELKCMEGAKELIKYRIQFYQDAKELTDGLSTYIDRIN